MPLGYPDIIIHNNPNNAIVDSSFVRGGGRIVDNLIDLYALSTKTDQLTNRITKVWVTSQNQYYILVDILNVNNSNGWLVEISGNNASTSGVISINNRKGNLILTTSDFSEGTNFYFNNNLARQSISENIDGISYNSTSGIFSLDNGKIIPNVIDINNGNVAFGWGNQSTQGFIQSTINTTYLNLVNLINTNNLIPGNTYKITDFYTTHRIYDTNTINIGINEPINIIATDTNKISKIAHSSLYPNDYIEYDYTLSLCEDLTTPRTGYITKRIDNRNNETPYDLRNVVWRRYDYTFNNYPQWNSGSNFIRQNVILHNNSIFYTKKGVVNSTITPTVDGTNFIKIIDNLKFGYTNTSNHLGNIEVLSNGTSFNDYLTFNSTSFNVYNNIINIGSFNNVFYGSNVNNNIIGSNNHSNTFGNNIINNILGNDFYENTIIGNFMDNRIKSGYKNLFQNNFNSNEFNMDLFSNTFLGEVNNNNINGNMFSNVIGFNFNNNMIYGLFYGMVTCDNFESNIINAHISSKDFYGKLSFTNNTIIANSQLFEIYNPSLFNNVTFNTVSPIGILWGNVVSVIGVFTSIKLE